jgi:lipoic acid synthetase
MAEYIRKPEWLRIKLNTGNQYQDIRRTLQKGKLTTVCTEANCPNQHECWGQYKTATFMVLGEICTRGCRFCSVHTGKPGAVDIHEPEEVALAVKELDLKHAVITMVTRDDLDDGGAEILAETVRAVRKENKNCTIEILSSDLRGKEENIITLAESKPEVISHNIETVRRLKKEICSGATYENSIEVLKMMKKHFPDSVVKSSIMIGLGETYEEIMETMDDLLFSGVSILNIGQYLQPSKKNLPVKKYWTPEEFEELKEQALKKGFAFCESGPLVRSSYHAGKHYAEYKALISE